jgi:guanylate kinase
VLLEIDVQGAAQVKKLQPQAVVILVLAPSREAQEARLHGRGDDEAVIARRLAGAPAEEVAGRAMADHTVVNDDLNRAVEEVAAIVEGHRRSRARPPAG